MHFSHFMTLQALASTVTAVPFWSRSTTEIQVVGNPLSPVASIPTLNKHSLNLNKRASYQPTAIPGNYASTVLTHHNIHRWNHTAVNMTYSSTLAGYAQTLASSCSYGHNTSIGGGGYGQNIAAIGSSSSTYGSKSASTVAAYATTEQWYNGEFNAFLPSYYGQASPDMTNFANWGHLTQVVWKSSLQVGCATQYCPTGTVFAAPFTSWYTVCNYSPPGNYLKQFDKGVGRPQGNKTVHVTV